MRTIVLFIITMVAGVACIGLEIAKALPLSGVAAGIQLKLSIEEVGWRRRVSRVCVSSALRILPAWPIPTILLRLPFITHLPIRHTLTIDHTAITGLITLRTNQATTELPELETC
jgi:hypothetical protein